MQNRYPDIDIGSYPAVRRRRFGVSVVLRGTDGGVLERALAELKEMLREPGLEPEEEPSAPAGAGQ